jgi:hypothetical protein
MEHNNKTVSCTFKHRTLTMLSFRAQNILSILCSIIFGCLSARCCIIFCKLATHSAQDGLWIMGEPNYKNPTGIAAVLISVLLPRMEYVPRP